MSTVFIYITSGTFQKILEYLMTIILSETNRCTNDNISTLSEVTHELYVTINSKYWNK